MYGTTENGEAALPPGYSIRCEESVGVIALRRPDGSVVARFAFSAFSPSPEALLDAAEEDLLGRRPSRAEEP